MVGSGLGRSWGSGGSLASCHGLLPSLGKGKERLRGALGERSGVPPEGDVTLGSAMSNAMKGCRMEGGDVEPAAALLSAPSVLCRVRL